MSLAKRVKWTVASFETPVQPEARMVSSLEPLVSTTATARRIIPMSTSTITKATLAVVVGALSVLAAAGVYTEATRAPDQS